MPVRTEKEDGGYTNSTPNGVKGRHMTKENADAQRRPLNAIDHGFKPNQEKAHKAFWKGKKQKR